MGTDIQIKQNTSNLKIQDARNATFNEINSLHRISDVLKIFSVNTSENAKLFVVWQLYLSSEGLNLVTEMLHIV